MRRRGNIASGRPRAAWPLIILASGLFSGGLAAADWHSPIRALITLWFLGICPGMALVRPLRLGDRLVEATLAVALSVALATIVASAILYAGLWSPMLILGILIAIGAVGSLLELLLPRTTGASAAAASEREGGS